jgi:hypothetical protein
MGPKARMKAEDAAPVPIPVAHASSLKDSFSVLTTSRLNLCHWSRVIRSWARRGPYWKPKERKSESVGMEKEEKDSGVVVGYMLRDLRCGFRRAHNG